VLVEALFLREGFRNASKDALFETGFGFVFAPTAAYNTSPSGSLSDFCIPSLLKS